jgi:hypothetical protein
MNAPLALYAAAKRALVDARSVDEVRGIRNHSEAIRAYAKQAKDREMEADAVEIRMRAERRLGTLMAAQKATVGLNEGGRPSKTGFSENPVLLKLTLAEAGINENLAHSARQLAAVPERRRAGGCGGGRC